MLQKAIIIALLSVLVYVVVDKLLFFDLHRHYYPHYPGNCRQIKNAGLGSENFHITKDGLAFITSGCSMSTMSPGFIAYMKKYNIYKGRILLYNFNKPELGAVTLTLEPSASFNPETFRPHGISVLEDARGEHILYVVSHPSQHPQHAQDTVEKFVYNSRRQTLVHKASITGHELRITNDLAVLGEDRFYITNYQYFKDPRLAFLEAMLSLPWGGVLYYNGSEFTRVTTGLSEPNGVVISHDGRYVYVAMCILKRINVYRREDDNVLTEVQSIPVYTIVDNLHLSQDGGTLYATGHPLTYKVVEHMEDPHNKAPSHVLQFRLSSGLVVEDSGSELLYDDGKLVAASTQAAVYGRTLLVGSLVDSLVVCDLPVGV